MDIEIGCDIVENDRLRNKDINFINKVLTEKELLEYKNEEYLFGRFAAKEAIMKVLDNTKDLSFLDIEILNNKKGKPIVNIKNVKVSISHEKNYTIATAILIKK